MKHPAAKSAYLGWLSAAIASDQGASRTFAAAPEDLVLGYATGYDAADIAPFVRSLRDVFQGPVVLVVDDRHDVTALLAEHAVTAVFPEQIPGWEPHPVMARFAAYDRILQCRPETVNVLLTDVRDVIFQQPPFFPAPHRLEAFVELEGGTLGDHAFNMKYLKALAGEEMAQALADRPCICVGTVMGPRAAIMRFCRTLLMLAAIPRSEIGGAFGADQAACNLAIHMGLVDAEIVPNFGRVATVGLTPCDRLGFEDGEVINPNGSVSAIVHQHDRRPALADAVHDRWGRGLERRERVQPKSATERGRKLKQSLMRRLPELR